MKAPSFILIKRPLNTEARPPEPTLLQAKRARTRTHTHTQTGARVMEVIFLAYGLIAISPTERN